MMLKITAFDFYRIFDIALRTVILMCALVMIAFIMAIGARAAMAATLKAETVLTGDVLTVGDIFDNAGRNADYVLGPAPQPGSNMVLNSNTLIRIAMAVDLPWQPQSTADQIVVRRAATVIPAAIVNDAIAESLRGKVVDQQFKLDTGASKLDITLPHDMAGTIDVTNVSYNQRTARFEATVSAPSAANPVKQVIVTGSVRPMTMVPVLKSNLRNGDVIGDGDLEWVEMFSSDIQPDTFTRASDLNGMTPRRVAFAGKPVRTIDIQAPQLIERGETITIVFKEGPLSLTAAGKALQNGAKGENIRVINTASNRPLDGVVSGAREVIVKQ